MKALLKYVDRVKLIAWVFISIIISISFNLRAQTGLVAHWSFDEITNDQFVNHVDNQPGGTIYGCESIQGPVGNAISFDGIDDYARIPGNNMLPPDILSSLAKGSISLWFRVEQIPTEVGIRPVFYYGRLHPCNFFDAANEGLIIEIGHSPVHYKSKNLYFTNWTNGCTFPSLCYNTSDPIEEGKWYHYVLIVGDGYNTGYLNGQLMSDRIYSFGYSQIQEFFMDAIAPENLWIGKGYWNTNEVFFKGGIDEIKIFDYALSQMEVNDLYNEAQMITTAIPDSYEESETLVYPNPAMETITISFSNVHNGILIFKVFGAKGELVFQSQHTATNKSIRIDLSSLPKGQYIYSLFEDSRILKSDKLILL